MLTQRTVLCVCAEGRRQQFCQNHLTRRLLAGATEEAENSGELGIIYSKIESSKAKHRRKVKKAS